MAELIPKEVIKYTRTLFAEANRRVTMTLARQPSAHEEMLDFQVFASLDEVGPVILGSGVAVEIDTHWLGGRRHFEGRWEIADICVVIVLRRGGRMLWRKVGLLQSKRLYSKEVSVSELDSSDYQIGIGRLIDRAQRIPTKTAPRSFSFTEECVYAEMTSASRQVRNIEEYSNRYSLPVYYLLYNPPTMPFQGMTPRALKDEIVAENSLGCRVLTSRDAHLALSLLPVGRTPRFVEMVRPQNIGGTDLYDAHGWRLENFVADEMMRCREGRLFETVTDQDLSALLYERTAPISSLVQISVDMPGE